MKVSCFLTGVFFFLLPIINPPKWCDCIYMTQGYVVFLLNFNPHIHAGCDFTLDLYFPQSIRFNPQPVFSMRKLNAGISSGRASLPYKACPPFLYSISKISCIRFFCIIFYLTSLEHRTDFIKRFFVKSAIPLF